MRRQVLVVGHADADGHLIAEQIRRNLQLIDSFDVDVVVDPQRTKDHKSWTKLEEIKEIEDADLVFFVDLMFAPSTFVDEANALVDFVDERPGKQFFLIDHHPLPLKRLEAADNLRVIYRPDVFECTLGPRSGMMVVAALCENQASRVSEVRQPLHDTLALGMRRAAALGGELPGEKLLALLESDCWELLVELGKDDKEFHRTVRGRRVASTPQSDTLQHLNKTADSLLGNEKRAASVKPRTGRTEMSYDLDVGQVRYTHDDGHPPRLRNAPVYSKDLEAIITLLEVAALSLTTSPGQTFTLEELLREARDIAGPEIDIDERDVRIVLEKQGFLKRAGGQLCLK